jgi:hypothetical protein
VTCHHIARAPLAIITIIISYYTAGNALLLRKKR